MSLTDGQVEGLLSGYIERKKFESKVLVSILGEVMISKKSEMSLGSLAAMGFGIRGA